MRAGAAAAVLVLGLGAVLRTAGAVGSPGWSRASALRRLRPRRSSGRRPSALGLPRAPRWLAPVLADAAIAADPAVLWSLWLGSAVALPVGALMAGGPVLALLAVGFCVLGPFAGLRARRGSGDARVEAALPGALEAMARALRSGASLRQAVGEAAGSTPGPLRAELARVAAEAGHGRALAESLEALAERRPLPGVRLAVAALCLGVETGGAQARAVDGVAATLRDRRAVSAEVQALSAQARLSAIVIGLAPLGFGVFAAGTDQRTSRFLLGTPAGLLLLGAGLALDALGWVWMRHLCRASG